MKSGKRNTGSEVDKAEVWLERGASRDDLRRMCEEEGGALGTRTGRVRGRERGVGAWDMVGGRPRVDGMEGAGRG
mgnify:CR=1 FL=1